MTSPKYCYVGYRAISEGNFHYVIIRSQWLVCTFRLIINPCYVIIRHFLPQNHEYLWYAVQSEMLSYFHTYIITQQTKWQYNRFATSYGTNKQKFRPWPMDYLELNPRKVSCLHRYISCWINKSYFFFLLKA